MKTIYLLFSICIIALSCKKSSDPKAEIVGKWSIQRDSVKEYSNGALIYVNNDPNTTDNGTAYTQFNSNGSGTTVVGINIVQFTYSISGNQITINELIPANGTVMGHAQILMGTIKSISSNSLHLYFDTKATYGLDMYETTEAQYLTK